MGDLIKNNNYHALSKAFDTESMEAMLEEGSAKMGRNNAFLTKKSFAPSGVGYGSGTCPRYWYMAFHGANFVYDNTARERANMDAGTAAGERIAKLFENAGILNASEFKIINEDPPIFGYGDLAVTWQGEQMVGEVKTTRTESFNTRATQMAAPGYQLIQLLIYMRVLNKDKGFFVLEDKNDHRILILPVKMTEQNAKLVDYVFEWMRTVKAASDADTMPTRPFTKSSMQCKSCPVSGDCWAGYTKQTQKREGSDPNPGVVDLPPLRRSALSAERISRYQSMASRLPIRTVCITIAKPVLVHTIRLVTKTRSSKIISAIQVFESLTESQLKTIETCMMNNGASALSVNCQNDVSIQRPPTQ
jgi:hypothetical protein